MLVTIHLPTLLKKYKLTKFLCFREIFYPRLIRMFYANLRLTDDKVSYYVMHKHMIIDVKLLAKEFETNASPPKFKARSFPYYKKEFSIDTLFPC